MSNNEIVISKNAMVLSNNENVWPDKIIIQAIKVKDNYPSNICKAQFKATAEIGNHKS